MRKDQFTEDGYYKVFGVAGERSCNPQDDIHCNQRTVLLEINDAGVFISEAGGHAVRDCGERSVTDNQSGETITAYGIRAQEVAVSKSTRLSEFEAAVIKSLINRFTGKDDA